MRVELKKDMCGELWYRVPELRLWEEFEPFVQKMVWKLQGRIIAKYEDVDVRIWEVWLDGVTLVFDIDVWEEPFGVYLKKGKLRGEEQLQRVVQFLKDVRKHPFLDIFYSYMVKKDVESTELLKNISPKLSRSVICKRNILFYQDVLGPTVDFLYAKGYSWEEIIYQAVKPRHLCRGYKAYIDTLF